MEIDKILSYNPRTLNTKTTPILPANPNKSLSINPNNSLYSNLNSSPNSINNSKEAIKKTPHL